MAKAPRFKVVISDCHLSAGRFFEGRLNPHEDFKFDDEMCDLIRHFSTGDYGETGLGPVEVELFLAGDVLDFLNVPYHGEFEDEVTEEIALYKLEAILAGHSRVMQAIRDFASRPGKTVTYMIGNHDADLAFESVRKRLTEAWDPAGRYPSEKVRILHDIDRIRLPEGVEIRHGQQLDGGNDLDFEQPIIRSHRGTRILNLPWSSVYVLKIVNRLKWEREFLDKVRPVRAFVLFGMMMDPVFTFRFVLLSAIFFLRTRLKVQGRRRFSVGKFLETVKQEAGFFRNLEKEAREILDKDAGLKTIIFGHTHYPMDKVYPDGKQYINTGTWTRMINIDWSGWGQGYRRTFALVRLEDNGAHCELRQWMGTHGPHAGFNG